MVESEEEMSRRRDLGIPREPQRVSSGPGRRSPGGARRGGVAVRRAGRGDLAQRSKVTTGDFFMAIDGHRRIPRLAPIDAAAGPSPQVRRAAPR